MIFSDTSNGVGIVQTIDDLVNTSEASYSIKKKTRDINEALNRYWLMAISADGTWKIDDTNLSDQPIVYTDLVSGTGAYSVAVDGTTPANDILEIERVEVKDANGDYIKLKPLSKAEIIEAIPEYFDTNGTPMYYEKTGKFINLYPKPDYASTDGLLVYGSRTPSYFASTDTTKEAGIPKTFHYYLALRPSWIYATRKGLPQANSLKNELTEMEELIKEFYSKRQEDKPLTFRAKFRSSR